jgi:hypothetical protein
VRHNARMTAQAATAGCVFCGSATGRTIV